MDYFKIKYVISTSGEILTQKDGYHESLVKKLGGFDKVCKIGTVYGELIGENSVSYHAHDHSTDYGGELAIGEDLLNVITHFEIQKFNGEVFHKFIRPDGWAKNTFPDLDTSENREILLAPETEPPVKPFNPFSIN